MTKYVILNTIELSFSGGLMNEQLTLALEDTRSSFRATRCLSCVPCLMGRQIVSIEGGGHDTFCSLFCLERALAHTGYEPKSQYGTSGRTIQWTVAVELVTKRHLENQTD